MLVHKHRIAILPSSGSGSANTLKFSGAELSQIFAKATTTTTNYDILLEDEDGDTVYEALNIENDYRDDAVDMPLRGIYTIRIQNASADENIVVKLMVNE